MASSDKDPGLMPGEEGKTPGKPMSTTQKMVDQSAHMVQSLKPINHFAQHVCTFNLYSHDMCRHIETHHFISRLNQDLLQCAVYDSADPSARLIGVEYIISDNLFETLPLEEQKLWHSHAYEIKSGLWINPGMAETVIKPELQSMVKTYGKFWCTWQVDRGDKLPLGAPALMMSAQPEKTDLVKPELIKERDQRYGIKRDDLIRSREGIEERNVEKSRAADNWRKTGKGFAVDIEGVDMKLI